MKIRVLVGGVLLFLLFVIIAAFASQDAPLSPLPAPPSSDTSSGSSLPKNSSADIVQEATPPQSVSKAAPRIDQSRGSVATIVASDESTYPLRIYKPLLTPNDPGATQWWTAGTGLDVAWGIGAGPVQTTVAVIDTGFALAHEEFVGRWAINAGEKGPTASQAGSQLNCTDRGLALNQSCNLVDDNRDGIVDNESGATTKQNPSRLNCSDQGVSLDKSCNRIDDDANGYVDDVSGWDFVNQDNSSQAGEINPNGQGTAHGTEVSGVLAASGNNGKGIAGVNWATKILPLQAIDDDEYGDTLTVANAVEYAADRGVDVISLSLGASAEDPYLRQVIHYALDKGSIVVAASGNDGCDCISYPARYPEVVAVGAENSSGNPASFSSYGSSLDILAPGSNITTSVWSAANPTSAYMSGVAGTSFATPYVSGLLSLARSHQSDASWAELLAALLSQADHKGLSVSSPTSPTLGYGYARAGRVMSRVTSASSPLLRYQFGPVSSADTLSSSLTYQCESGDFPSAALFELSRGTTVRYTISPLEQVRAAGSGWTTKKLWHSCVGLPGDTPTTIRTINLFSEIRNDTSLKAN